MRFRSPPRRDTTLFDLVAELSGRLPGSREVTGAVARLAASGRLRTRTGQRVVLVDGTEREAPRR